MTNPIITRSPVESSCITAVGYAEAASILEVEFQSGAVYRYASVPSDVHAAFMAATSKGAYLNRFIKGRYAEERSPPERRRSAALSPWPDRTADGLEQADRRPLNS